MKKSRYFFGLFSIVVIFFWVEVIYLYFPMVSAQEGKIFYLRPGTSKKRLITELTEKKIIRYPVFFFIFSSVQINPPLKTGEYLFPRGSTPLSIWRQVINGTGFAFHPFTIVPGWSFTQLKNALMQTGGLRHLIRNLDDQQLMARLGHPTVSPEGEFFPETYYYTKGICDLVILKRAIELMQGTLIEAWKNRARDLPYQTPYEALIAASLIEKEAYLGTEQAIIAGVLVNRLKKNMLLQFDPTVIYGLRTRYTGVIRKEDLIEDNPYNTYVHKGLPPTPIAMPGRFAILAALHPVQHEFYYFVAKGNGSHQFSKNLSAHREAVNAALKKY